MAGMRDPILKVAPVTQVTSPREAFAHAKTLSRGLLALYEQVAAYLDRRGMPEAAEGAARLAREQEELRVQLRQFAGEHGFSPSSLPMLTLELPQEFTSSWEEIARSTLATPYRIFAVGVEDAARGFAYFSHLAAHAGDRETQETLESMAMRQLDHAERLRRLRRLAYHGGGRQEVRLLPEVSSLADLRDLIAQREAQIRKILAAVAGRLAEVGERDAAEVLANEFLAAAPPISETTTLDISDRRDLVELLVLAQRPLEHLADDLERLLPQAQDEWRQELEQALEGVLRGLGLLTRLIEEAPERPQGSGHGL